jgi:hypothetical protein
MVVQSLPSHLFSATKRDSSSATWTTARRVCSSPCNRLLAMQAEIPMHFPYDVRRVHTHARVITRPRRHRRLLRTRNRCARLKRANSDRPLSPVRRVRLCHLRKHRARRAANRPPLCTARRILLRSDSRLDRRHCAAPTRRSHSVLHLRPQSATAPTVLAVPVADLARSLCTLVPLQIPDPGRIYDASASHLAPADSYSPSRDNHPGKTARDSGMRRQRCPREGGRPRALFDRPARSSDSQRRDPPHPPACTHRHDRGDQRAALPSTMRAAGGRRRHRNFLQPNSVGRLA